MWGGGGAQAEGNSDKNEGRRVQKLKDIFANTSICFYAYYQL